MNYHEFNEFWEWLIDKSEARDWLESWLGFRKEEWDRMPVCECGHRVRKTVEVRSKAFYCGSGRRIVFERITRCANCLKIVETEDYREPIILAIRDGSIRVSDLELLKEELGETDG